MALNIFDAIKNKSNELSAKLTDNNGEATASMAELKKNLKNFKVEKVKMYEFIGIEMFDLYKKGDCNIADIEPFCQKLQELEQHIETTTKAIEEKDKNNSKNHICECGQKLKKDSKFCPQCGKKCIPIIPVCPCGEELPKNAKFCSSCGMSSEDIMKEYSINETSDKKECICGAVVEVDDFICSECGRKLK